MKKFFKKLFSFDGSDIEPQHDVVRLSTQIARVHQLMSDGKWRTLSEISASTGDPQSSVSAQLRNLRKKRFGGYTISKQRSGNKKNGLFKYRMS